MGEGVGASAQHREPRACPQRDAPPLSCLHGTDAGGSPSPSATTPAHTPGSLVWPYVQTQLAKGCSPEQIAGRLKHAYPHDMGKQLSAETI